MPDTQGFIVTGLASLLTALGFQRTMFRWQDAKIKELKDDLALKQDKTLCVNISDTLGKSTADMNKSIGKVFDQIAAVDKTLTALVAKLEERDN